jgi:hypothetical protein
MDIMVVPTASLARLAAMRGARGARVADGSFFGNHE